MPHWLAVAVLGLPVLSAGAQSNAVASPGPAETVCPWLTAGSAALALGGDVNVTVTVPNHEQGTCRFVRQDQPEHSLEIAVGKGEVPACPAESPRPDGIGNEAERCRLTAAHADMAEMVSGRVRNLHFAAILRGSKRAIKSTDERGDSLEQVAEQVAGNLF